MKSFIKFSLLTMSLLSMNFTSVDAKADILSELKSEVIKIVKDEINTFINSELSKTSSESVKKQEPASELIFSDFEQSRVDYQPLDHLNRARQATAYLTKENVTKQTEERGSQRFTPTGFVKNAKIWDRGHLIAYSLTYNLNENGQYSKGHDGSLDNPLNLFTQSSQSNRGEMKSIENEVRQVLKSGEKVIYRVTLHFENDELVARCARVEAVSEFGTLDIDEIVENVQDGKQIDYATGRVK